jgi:hypothetical protein
LYFQPLLPISFASLPSLIPALTPGKLGKSGRPYAAAGQKHSDTSVQEWITMSKSHSTSATKPAKPYPEFPLFPHATRRWAKKIPGHMHYFGPWDDPDGALAKYLEQKDDLHAGRKPRPESA